MFTRSQHGHKDWMHAGNTVRCEEQNPRLSVAVGRINYLCSNSWGESSRFETHPTEAVFTDRKVRGHASRHVVGARLQGLRAGHQGGEWLEIYYISLLFCKVMPSATMYHWHGGSLQKTSEQKGKRRQVKYSSALTQRLHLDLAIDCPPPPLPRKWPHHSLSCSLVSFSSIHLHLRTALLGLISSMAPLVYTVVNPFITLLKSPFLGSCHWTLPITVLFF